MINDYLFILISSKEILLSVIVSLITTIALCYFLFSNRSSDLFIKISLSISLSLISSLLLLLVSFIPMLYITKELNTQFLTVSIMFFLFYFINLIIKFIVDLKNALFKGKKRGVLIDALEDIRKGSISRVIRNLIFLFILLLSIFVIGNGKINILLISLMISGIISSLSCIFIIPLFLKISEKVLK